MIKIKKALISVSDKSNVLELAKSLSSYDIEILSTGGTAKLLRENKINVTEVSDYTKFPEMLDGRVKTLHPKIHGGILGRRDNPEHNETMKNHEIDPIDLVVVNLYPFEETISQEGCTLELAIENIDIGGPAMIRSAAKNYQHVAVLTNPEDYKDYVERVKPIAEKFGGDYIVRGGTNQIIEGTWQYSRTVVIKFPSYEKALEWYNSEEYQPIKKIRLVNANTNGIIIQGA